MIKTPTYHVFNMYKYHQDAMLVDSHIDTETIGVEEEYQVPNLTESVSVDENGVLHITVTQPFSYRGTMRLTLRFWKRIFLK